MKESLLDLNPEEIDACTYPPKSPFMKMTHTII